MSYDKAFKMSMYRNMLEQRVFEKAVQEQYEEGNIPNSAHLYLGQEAIAAGVSMALRPDDYILPSHFIVEDNLIVSLENNEAEFKRINTKS